MKITILLTVILNLFLIFSVFVFFNLTFSLPKKYDGRYIPALDFITIRVNNRDIETIKDTTYHEIGHFIYYKCLNESQRDEYYSFFKDKKCYYQNPHYQKIREDFAQSYADYNNRNFGSLCYQKIRFFKELEMEKLRCK